MARKFIVTPEEMYKNLLKSQNSEIIGTDSSKINLDKIKKSRTKILLPKMYFITKNFAAI